MKRKREFKANLFLHLSPLYHNLKYEIESKISEQNTNIFNLEKRSNQIQKKRWS